MQFKEEYTTVFFLFCPRAEEMKENVAEFLRRTILKIPLSEMKSILEAWDFLSEDQLQTINLKQRKDYLAQEVILLCEVTVFKIINQIH